MSTENKKIYEVPMIEVTEFSTEDTIASSGAALVEELW